jgi:D-sedoheptulose 7-phosphate isomerase
MTDGEAGRAVRAHLEGLAATARDSAEALATSADAYARRVIATLERGGKLMFAGNGGSAATAEHAATEYVVRFRRERRALPAIALTAGSAQLTAIANDFGYERAFARALEAWGRPGDLLVLHSTSGESANLLAAARAAKGLGVGAVGMLGETGGSLRELVEIALLVPSRDPARIQEIHLAVEHAVAELVDARFAASGPCREET